MHPLQIRIKELISKSNCIKQAIHTHEAALYELSRDIERYLQITGTQTDSFSSRTRREEDQYTTIQVDSIQLKLPRETELSMSPSAQRSPLFDRHSDSFSESSTSPQSLNIDYGSAYHSHSTSCSSTGENLKNLSSISELNDETSVFSELRNLDKYSIEVESSIHGKMPEEWQNYDTGESPLAVFAVWDTDVNRIAWRFVQDYQSLRNFDKETREICTLKHIRPPVLPDQNLFNSASPYRIHQRVSMLNDYVRSLSALLQELNASPEADLASRYRGLMSRLITSNPVSVPQDTLCGYLAQRVGFRQHWKVKYFVHHGAYLDASDRPGDSHETILLSNSIIEPLPDPITAGEDEPKHAFAIHVAKDDGVRYTKYVLSAETEARKNLWVSKLSKATSLMRSASDGLTISVYPYQLLRKRPPKNGSSNKSNSSGRRSIHSAIKESFCMIPARLHHSNHTSSSIDTSIISDSRLEQNSQASKLFVQKNTSDLLRPTNLLFSVRSPTPTIAGNGTSGDEANGPGRSEFLQIPVETPSGHTLQKARRSAIKLPSECKNNVFGTTVERAISFSALTMSDGSVVPCVVARCLQYLQKTEAHKEEGLFRVPGSSTTIDALTVLFDTHKDIDLNNQKIAVDAYSVASVLKRFFLSLEKALAPVLEEESFSLCLMSLSEDKRRETLKQTVQCLPIQSYDLLKAITGYLHLLCQHESQNKMNATNLSVFLNVTLQIGSRVLTLLIQNYPYIFSNDAAQI